MAKALIEAISVAADAALQKYMHQSSEHLSDGDDSAESNCLECQMLDRVDSVLTPP